TEDVFAPVCEVEKIALVRVSSQVIEGATAMMSRLFLTRFVPSRYDQYLYMDGDVLIRGSLDPLLDTPVPAGCFLAANDPFTFLLEDHTWQSRRLHAHLREAGIGPEQARSYFNTGVLRIHRSGWEQTGERAWKHFSKNRVASRFPDQDAMNLAAGGSRLPMSLRWNYPVFLSNARLGGRIAPRIHHFMSAPKPWQGCFAPWTEEACEPYQTALRTYPQMAGFAPLLSLATQAKYALQQDLKQAVETVTWGLSKRRARILAYEQMCAQPALVPHGSEPVGDTAGESPAIA
ncbi:MAG TPA: glycosyltransferase, partial [Acidobacteriaceae bacterium]